ncbi:hypothetical protein SISSUDRAFT_1059028 [Sistotremastrum suecicum HHB10207 ss-3]|uniref:Uncharacterized protein n=1 Tax=Sistotremastrum suecicum HHB10207 ss-3 TaxID=1314776 RepID=A0A166GQU4_9AGAM|nr:hypothetical protein SISSUDRAFT_1059028 [Sistotremastrum suecicum HHB10207 ss-3]
MYFGLEDGGRYYECTDGTTTWVGYHPSNRYTTIINGQAAYILTFLDEVTGNVPLECLRRAPAGSEQTTRPPVGTQYIPW